MGPASRGLKKFLAASSTLVMLLLTLAILAQPAAVNAMGDAPSTCNNRYDGRITYFIISNGTRTFNAIANPGVTFDVKANSYYNVTFVIHTANASSNNNTDPGTTWYNTDINDFGQGVCVPSRTNTSIGPNQNVIINRTHLTDPRGTGTQYVHWGTWENGMPVGGVSYHVNWIAPTSTTTSTTTPTSTTTATTSTSFDVGTGSDRLLVVGVSANNNNVLSIAFGGVQLTRAVSSFNNNDAEFWNLVNPTGTGDIVVTFAGPTAAVVGAYSFSGVSQSSPIPTAAKNSNTAAGSPSVSISTQYPNSWVLDLPSIYGGVTLGSPSCTQQWDANMPGAITGASSSTIAGSPGQVSCGWTASNGGDLWDDVAIELAASG
ncbi:MAG: hypothetical protein E6K84_00930 [Thaumarchaeota archaeon]|nr:MAG: hypothetical protein E6K84_00930 [Nitrososphaerota archaeon]